MFVCNSRQPRTLPAVLRLVGEASSPLSRLSNETERAVIAYVQESSMLTTYRKLCNSFVLFTAVLQLLL